MGAVVGLLPVLLAAGPLALASHSWNAASFRDRLTGQILQQGSGETGQIVSMSGSAQRGAAGAGSRRPPARGRRATADGVPDGVPAQRTAVLGDGDGDPFDRLRRYLPDERRVAAPRVSRLEPYRRQQAVGHHRVPPCGRARRLSGPPPARSACGGSARGRAAHVAHPAELLPAGDHERAEVDLRPPQAVRPQSSGRRGGCGATTRPATAVPAPSCSWTGRGLRTAGGRSSGRSNSTLHVTWWFRNRRTRPPHRRPVSAPFQVPEMA